MSDERAIETLAEQLYLAGLAGWTKFGAPSWADQDEETREYWRERAAALPTSEERA